MQHLSFLIQPNEPNARAAKSLESSRIVGALRTRNGFSDIIWRPEDRLVVAVFIPVWQCVRFTALGTCPHASQLSKDLAESNQLDKRPSQKTFIAKKKAKQDFLRNLMQGPQRAFIIEQIAFCWLALTIFKWQRKEESETFICLFSGRTGVLSPKQTRKIRISISIVEVPPEKVYYGKRKFTMVKIKDDPSPISIGGYISILSKLYLFC